MISKIIYKNFKAFKDQKIGLKPLTFLLGPNNSGKSSIISGIRMLSQTVNSFDDSIPLLLNGELGDFGTYRDIIFNNNIRKHLELGFEITLSENFKRRYSVNDNLLIILDYKYKSSIREIILKEIKYLTNHSNCILLTKYSDESERQILQKIVDHEIPIQIRANLSKNLRVRNFLIEEFRPLWYLREQDSKYETFFKEIEHEYQSLRRYSFIVNNTFKEMEYIGAMRLPPSRTYLYSGERRVKVGSNGNNAINILSMDSLRSGRKSKNIKEKVVNWLNKSEIASNIKINELSDRYYEIQLQHPKTKEFQNFADVGYGTSQVIPVLIAGYNLEREGIFMVEEPEIHLHPKAQSELGEFFFDLYKQGIQSIVETHSEHLILRMQQLVASKKISKEDVVFYYIYAKDNKKVVHELSLDEKGKFIQDWPEGFFPERLEETKKLAKLRYTED
jgi:predicted ATPase